MTIYQNFTVGTESKELPKKVWVVCNNRPRILQKAVDKTVLDTSLAFGFNFVEPYTNI